MKKKAATTIPQALMDSPRWLVAKVEPDKDNPEKLNKLPISCRTGRIFDVSSNVNEALLVSYEEARNYSKAHPEFRFLGYCISGSEFLAFDLDHCYGPEHTEAWAEEVIAQANSYTEESPSQTGGRILLRRPEGFKWPFRPSRKTVKLPKPGQKLEVFNTGFVTITGWTLRNGLRAMGGEELKDLVQAFEQKYGKQVSTEAEANSNGGASPIPDGERHSTLTSIAGSMRKRGLGPEAILAALREHNAQHCQPPLPEKDLAAIATCIGNKPHSLLTPELADVGNGDRLLLYGKGNYRYVAAYKRWAVYDGRRWPVEDREQDTIRSEAHGMVRQFIGEAALASLKETGEFAFGCLATGRISNMLREAQSHATLHMAELDRDPLLVNFRNGTFDAHKGKLREHQREDYITAVIPFDYNPKAKCPRFVAFLQETFSREPELIAFVQRAQGYCLTGDTSAKCIFLAHGPKDTAKTTMLSLIKSLLGDYGGRIKVESLMVERGRPMDSNAQADLADLRGKRFVMTSETGQGQRLREELVKLLSQGQDTYKAVRKYENPFEFRETWKIWMDCNHLPVVHGTDDAVWDRLIVIPFRHVVPSAAQNRQLSAELIADEAEGILAWMIEGLRNWKQDGRLILPASLGEQRAQWRRESDELLQWLEERCVQRGDAATEGLRLFQDYKLWRETRRLHDESIQIFSRKMQEHGFNKQERGHEKTPHWIGVGLLVGSM